MPELHPARDMQDTFYVQQNPDWLFARTQVMFKYAKWKAKTANSRHLPRAGISE
jgi:phenylalanyl-tRNA synthetase alpha subunit